MVFFAIFADSPRHTLLLMSPDRRCNQAGDDRQRNHGPQRAVEEIVEGPRKPETQSRRGDRRQEDLPSGHIRKAPGLGDEFGHCGNRKDEQRPRRNGKPDSDGTENEEGDRVQDGAATTHVATLHLDTANQVFIVVVGEPQPLEIQHQGVHELNIGSFAPKT